MATMRIREIANSAGYRMNEQFEKFPIFEISCFWNWKNSENLLIFQVVKFWKLDNFQSCSIW